jgi:hypothetical protein
VLRAETAFLSRGLNARLSKNQDPIRIRRCRFWRNVLERLIIALADQQLVTGFAILITGWIIYHDQPHLHGAHFVLVLYLSSLSSSSHLAAIITLRKYFGLNPALAALRIVLIAAFAIGLIASVAISQTIGPLYSLVSEVLDRVGFWLAPEPLAITISILPIIWTFWTGIWQIIPETRDQFTAWIASRWWPPIRRVGRYVCLPLSFVRYRPTAKTKDRSRRYARATVHYIFFLSPGTVFVLQIVFATYSLAMVLAQKFSPGDGCCTLNSQDENQMGYGQILACLMLALPIIAAFEAYKGEQFMKAQLLAPTDNSIEQQKAEQQELEAASSLESLLAFLPASLLASLPPSLLPSLLAPLRVDPGIAPLQRQDTEQRVGSTPSHPHASVSATTSSASFFSAVNQQPPQAQAPVQRRTF